MYPVEIKTDEIIESIKNNQIVFITSETGSGKSTKIPQIIYDNLKMKVLVTQPRRVAAISLSKRVSKDIQDKYYNRKNGKKSYDNKDRECKNIYKKKYNNLVGYKVRFEDTTNDKTCITYLTDGMLLRNFDKEVINSNKIIIIDEVHERSVRTDILLGLIKSSIIKGNKSKFVMMSATADIEDINSYFNKSNINIKIINIEGRIYPVEIKYLNRKCSDYIQSTEETIRKIVSKEKNIGILVFLSGIEDINELYNKLIMSPTLEVLRLHSTLSDKEQEKIFGKMNKFNRIILSTNIAETSLTIPSINYVIDTGVMKNNYSMGGIERLGIVKISQSSANQRSGRAGRIKKGICYRLYREETFNNLEKYPIREILRSDLSSVSLTLLNFKINPVDFDYLTKPKEILIKESLKELYLLNMIDENLKLTELGIISSKFPLTPSMSKFIILSRESDLLPFTCAIVSMLTSGEVYSRRDNVDKYDSDLILLSTSFFLFYNSKNKEDMARELGFNIRSLFKSIKIFKQLLKINNYDLNSLNKNTYNKKDFENEDLIKDIFLFPSNEIIKKIHSYASVSFITKIAIYSGSSSYIHEYTGDKIWIHPSSLMFSRKCKCFGFVIAIQTSKLYAQVVFPYLEI